MSKLTLISHELCPFVQRAAIALTEKGVAFERITVDLANKPDWFLAISPLGKVPLLKVGDAVIFESAVILEYLEETQPSPLHPADALQRAEHRSWMEFGSTILMDLWTFYTAMDETAFQAKAKQLTEKFAPAGAAAGRGAVFRRRALQPGRCGVRPGVPLFRRLRPDRRLRHADGQAQARGLAPRLGAATLHRPRGEGGLSRAAVELSCSRAIPGCRP